MRRDLLLLGAVLVLLALAFSVYSGATGRVMLYHADGNRLVPASFSYVDRGEEYDVHQDPPYHYNYYKNFVVRQIGDKIFYEAAYKGYQCYGDLYIHYILGGREVSSPVGSGGLGYSQIGGISGGYSIPNNCQWRDQYIAWRKVPFLKVGSGGFDYDLGYVHYRALPQAPDGSRKVWDVCWALDDVPDAPYYCVQGYDYLSMGFRGWFYDYVRGKYGLAFYLSDLKDGSLDNGYYAVVGSSFPVSIPVATDGPCGIAAYYEDGKYHLINHVSSDGTLDYTDWYLTDRSGTFFFDVEKNMWVCLTSEGYEIYPGHDGWVAEKRFGSAPLTHTAWFGGSVVVDVNGDVYYFFRNDPDTFYYFGDSDADDIPDLWRLTGYANHRYEINPVQRIFIRWYDLPAVPRDVNHASLSFSLGVDMWPGANVSVQGFRLSVDGYDLNTGNDLNTVFTYDLGYGDHSICYSFSVVNGRDTDSYSGCIDVHVGYAPWDVGFAYRQEADEVVIIGHARDDGRIVSYEWNVDGNVVDVNGPVFRTHLSPGDHSVCLTVTDDDGIKVQSCGTVTVSSVTVPSGVQVRVDTRTRVLPVYQSVPVNVPSGVSALSVAGVPVRIVAGGLGLFLILLALVLG